jgi:hypothetical protein
VDGNHFSLALEDGADAQLERNYRCELYIRCGLCGHEAVPTRSMLRSTNTGSSDRSVGRWPRRYGRNHVIIEIKRADTTAAGIRKDVDTLTRFIGPDMATSAHFT